MIKSRTKRKKPNRSSEGKQHLSFAQYSAYPASMLKIRPFHNKPCPHSRRRQRTPAARKSSMPNRILDVTRYQKLLIRLMKRWCQPTNPKASTLLSIVIESDFRAEFCTANSTKYRYLWSDQSQQACIFFGVTSGILLRQVVHSLGYKS